MANQAHSTRTPLLPQAGAPSALLPRGASRQLGPVTLAIRAMRAELTKPRPIGRVTAAILTMRAAAPQFDQNAELRSLRRALADRIEADIAALDMLGGDPDAEPWLSSWAIGSNDDREEENEHGGDVQDEPHDPEEDDDRDSGCGDAEGALEAFGGHTGHFAAYA